MKCINCGAEFEAERCPECGLSRKYNKVLYRYEERQREKESGDYRPKHKKKKKKPVYKKWWVWAIIGLLSIVLLTSIFGGNDDNKDAELNNDDKIANPEGIPSTDASAANVEKEVESEDTQTFGKYTLTNTLYVDGTKAARIDINEGNHVLLSETGGMYTGDGTALEEELLFYNLLLFPFAVENDGVSAMDTKDVNGEDVVWAHMFKNGELYTATGEMPEGRYDNLDEEKLQGPDFAAVVDAATEFLTGKTLDSTSVESVGRDEIKAQATSATYQDLMRDPDAHKGEYIVLTVKLQQILDAGGLFSSETYYFGYTDESGYEFYFDDQYCFTDKRVDDNTKLLEDDILTVYGVFTGVGEFERALNSTTVEIPMVEMLYVDIGEDLSNDESRITLEEYEQIETGMTYDEIVEIIGGEGELDSETDLGIGSEYITRTYTWKGTGSAGGSAIIQIQDGKVSSKSQYGLE